MTLLLVLAWITAAGAQTALPAVTDLDAIVAYPAFFHRRSVVVLGEFQVSGNDHWLMTPWGSRIGLVGADASSLPAGLVEVKGIAIDIGRVDRTDQRFAPLELERLVEREGLAPWPPAGRLVVLLPQTARAWRKPQRPSLRDVALAPGLFAGETVTVAGAFRGRNLYGEVPAPPGRDRVEYLLRSRDAAIWVVGLSPRGKGFDFDPSIRRDVGRALAVTGIVRKAGGLAWIEGQMVQLSRDQLEPEPPPPPPKPVGPPPDVQFSVPTPGELDVALATTVRVQFTQTMARASFEGRVQVAYVTPPDVPASDRLEAPDFLVEYEPKDRLLIIRFDAPLERYRTVRVDLLEGITGVDGQKLRPWTLTFTTGDRSGSWSVDSRQ